MFSSTDAPKVYQPATIPTENTAAIEAARKKKAAEIQARSGRQSTILTEQTDRLGG